MNNSETVMRHQPNDHQLNPALWFIATPSYSLDELAKRLKSGAMTATARLGYRDGSHPKGYFEGQEITIRLCKAAVDGVCQGNCDNCGTFSARVTGLVMRRLEELTPQDLKETSLYKHWEEVRSDFSHFEQKNVLPEEWATIVHFDEVTPKS